MNFIRQSVFYLVCDFTLYDIVDDISINKHQNFVLNHFLERVNYYNQEKFNYKLYNIDLKTDI